MTILETVDGCTHAPTAAAELRRQLVSQELTFLMEAHDGMSARVASRAGFDALWASGLSMSTALGVRDSDEATWTQLLDVVAHMSHAADVPILVDGDTGYGSFNTARRFADKARRVGAAGICLEDKQFPKMNSFVGDSHRLADVADHVAKLRACRDVVGDDLVVVARTEALIVGAGMTEALDRAEAYREAGADALFIHSRRADVDEIAEFVGEWGGRLPVVIAPTTYAATTPTERFREMGISSVIWANHSMRAALRAMQHACRQIRARESVTDLGVELAPLADVFELFDYDELEATERALSAATPTGPAGSTR